MPLMVDGQSTKIKKGDVLCIDVHSEMVHFERDGNPITNSRGDGEDGHYWLMPSDGVQIKALAEIIADACGLSIKELGLSGDEWRFEFK